MKVDCYAWRGTVDVLIAKGEQAFREDKEAEQGASMWGGVIVACMILFIVLLVIAIVSETAFFAFLAAGFLVTMVVAIVMAVRHKRHDLDNGKLGTLLKLLSVLRADVPARSELEVKVDFRDYRSGGQLTGKEGGWLSSVKTYKYRHAWLEMKLALVDKSRVRFSISDDVTRKEKSKRKYTKVNERRSSEVTVTVDLDDRYVDAKKLAGRLSASRSPLGMKLVSVTGEGTVLRAVAESGDCRVVTGRHGATTTGAEHRVDGDSVLKLMLWVWHGLGAPAA
jgi:hypothetical protein